MSLLYWGEHCVECAAPGCYSTCDLYDPRDDMRCRRFVYGAMKNPNFPSLRGYGVEVSFKKWGKLEAFANLAMRPLEEIRRQEGWIAGMAPLAGTAGMLMSGITRRVQWKSGPHIALEKLVRRLDKKKEPSRLPEAFLLEVYNPGQEAVRLQLTFALIKDEAVLATAPAAAIPPYVTMVSFPPGYSRHEIEVRHFLHVIKTEKAFQISMIPEGDSNARLVFLTADLVRFNRKAVAAPMTAGTAAKQIKCVVWDLDNTMWDGILVEGDAVQLRPRVKELLQRLDERGILLSIASKNDHAAAMQKLEELGLADYFLYPQINWNPKSQSLKVIAERLNIGIDTFAFLDDNPFERDQVAQTQPLVVCVDARDMETLFTDERFQGSTSAEAKQRRQFYKEAISRETAQEEFGSNFLGFLATCGIELTLAPYGEEDKERVAELVQRTNQLNFSGHKYTREQLNEILQNPEVEKIVLKCSDKYGSYGTVGFCLVERGSDLLQVRDFMLSCRVQGKFIEQALFRHLMEQHNPEGTQRLWVNFKPTAKNKPALLVLETLGFRKCDPQSDRLLEGMVQTTPETLKVDIIKVTCGAVHPPAGRTENQAAENTERRIS